MEYGFKQKSRVIALITQNEQNNGNVISYYLNQATRN